MWILTGALSLTIVVMTSSPARAAEPQVIPNDQVVVVPAAPSGSTVPVNGELGGPDSQADVTAVAWPDEADGYVANTGDRLVAFTVEVTEPTSDGGLLGSGGPALILTVDGSPVNLDTSTISTDVAESRGSTGTGTESYVAAVPSNTHDVDVSMDDQGYTQALSLWTLQRATPAPNILYEGPSGSGLNDQLGISKQLTLELPGVGSFPAIVLITSASLSAFNGGGAVAPRGKAYLTVGMVADNSDAEMNGLYYPTNLTPLPGSAIVFTARNGRRYSAERSGVSEAESYASVNDDGLLDATYAFLVPSTTTGGVVSIGPGATTGYTDYAYLNSQSPQAVAVTAPVRFSVGFPAPTVPARQPTPPWVDEPVPDGGLPNKSGPGSGGLPIGVSVVLLLAVVAGVLLVRHRLRSKAEPPAEPESAPVPTTIDPERVDAPGAIAHQDSATLRIDFMGPVRIEPLANEPSEFARAFLCYVAAHDERPRSVDDAQTALWPLDATETDVTRKTFLNYVSDVRRLVSTAHLPGNPKRSGYRLRNVATDWHEFGALAAEANRAEASVTFLIRRRALQLVRGVPFESELSRWFQWTDGEGLRTEITKAVVKMAVDAHTERVHAGDLEGAEWSLRQGLRCNPGEMTLWACLADVIQARGDRSDADRFWRDAAAVLDTGSVGVLRERVQG